MTGEQRLRVALEMSDFARELTKAGIRSDHPDWTEAQVTFELIRLAFLPDPVPAGLRPALEKFASQSPLSQFMDE